MDQPQGKFDTLSYLSQYFLAWKINAYIIIFIIEHLVQTKNKNKKQIITYNIFLSLGSNSYLPTNFESMSFSLR